MDTSTSTLGAPLTPQKQPEDVRTFFDALRKSDCFYVAPLGANDDWCAGEAVVRKQHRNAPCLQACPTYPAQVLALRGDCGRRGRAAREQRRDAGPHLPAPGAQASGVGALRDCSAQKLSRMLACARPWPALKHFPSCLIARIQN